MSCPSYFIPQFSTVQVGQLIMYWGLELNVETTRHGGNSCFCKITLETTRAEATHAEATHEEVTHHSILFKTWSSLLVMHILDLGWIRNYLFRIWIQAKRKKRINK